MNLLCLPSFLPITNHGWTPSTYGRIFLISHLAEEEEDNETRVHLFIQNWVESLISRVGNRQPKRDTHVCNYCTFPPVVHAFFEGREDGRRDAPFISTSETQSSNISWCSWATESLLSIVRTCTLLPFGKGSRVDKIRVFLSPRWTERCS